MKTINMENNCVSCGHDTSLGSGRFVNRMSACISTGIDDVEKQGYMCEECQYEDYIFCDKCGYDILDDEHEIMNHYCHEED